MFGKPSHTLLQFPEGHLLGLENHIHFSIIFIPVGVKSLPSRCNRVKKGVPGMGTTMLTVALSIPISQ